MAVRNNRTENRFSGLLARSSGSGFEGFDGKKGEGT
jgi:hypothetical protein